MIRYALIAVVAVVAFLWWKSREAATVRRGTVYQPQPSVWAALGQLLGGAIGGAQSRPAQGTGQASKVSADGIYSLMGNQSPTTGSAFQLQSGLLSGKADTSGAYGWSASQTSSGPAGSDEETFQLKSSLLGGD